MDFLLPFQDDSVHGIEQEEHPVHPSGARKSDDIVGTAIYALLGREVHAAGDGPDGLEHLLPGGPELGIVVPQRDGERDAPVRDGLEDGLRRRNVRPAEHDVARVDHEVRPLGVQHLADVAERPLTAGVAGDVMGVRQLENFESSVGAIPEIPGNFRRERILSGFLPPAAGQDRSRRGGSGQESGIFEE